MILHTNKEEHVAESTTKAPKGATATSDNGDAPAPTPEPPKPTAMTVYIAFAWEDGAWIPVMDGAKQKEYKVPSGQGGKVQEQVLVELALADRAACATDTEREPATSFRIAVVSARFWVDEEFEQEPPPPPQFKPKGS